MAHDRGGLFGIFATGIVAVVCFTYVFSDREPVRDVREGEVAAAPPPSVTPPRAPVAEPPAPPPVAPEPVAVPVPAPEITPPAVVECDEVSCVLDDYRGACCAKYRPDKGYLQVYSKPVARVFVDDVDTELSTPTRSKALPLAPGKHRVTLQVGQDRYTFSVTIKAGQTERMMKDLR